MIARTLCLCTLLGSSYAAAVDKRQAPGTTSSSASASTPSQSSGPAPPDLTVPSYVSTYAPLAYLHSNEGYWPSDLVTHLNNVSPRINRTGEGIVPVQEAPSPLSLANLNASSIDNVFTYLTATTTINQPETTVDWLRSEYGKPYENRSAGATICILVNKTGVPNQNPPGDLDAFYFYFYSYNLGPDVLGSRFGSHVGDWEHTMIRFNAGQPVGMYLSSHDSGEGYAWSALQKSGERPVHYIAHGSHANYATPGNHQYSGNILVQDYSDAGVLWDPALNMLSYWYSSEPENLFVPAVGTDTPTAFLYPVLKWGDQAYPTTDPRQNTVLGFQRFSDGPTGPLDKTLVRTGLSFDASLAPVTTLPAIVNGTTQPVQPVRSSASSVDRYLRAPGPFAFVFGAVLVVLL